MLGILDALKCFDLGYKTTCNYDILNKSPDEFEFRDYYGVIKAAVFNKHNKPKFDYNPLKTSKQYYNIAFAYYWEKSVEQDMLTRDIVFSSNQIRFEMIQSLRVINELLDYVLSSVKTDNEGINWDRYIANKGYSKLYGKALCKNFLKNPATIDVLANSVLFKQDLCCCSAYVSDNKKIHSIIMPLINLCDDNKCCVKNL